ncbi:hypothetical protein Tco_1377190 [Tanacetum coccineum]
MLVSYHKLNPQALLKLYLIHLGWKQCKKNFCTSSYNRLSILSAWYEVEVLFEGCLMMSIYSQEWMLDHSGGPPVKVGDEAVHKELGDGMERATTTASSLEAE